jgi:hypothetical protein
MPTPQDPTPPTSPVAPAPSERRGTTTGRRATVDRRAAAERAAGTGLERRRGPGRRREDDRRSAEEGEMNAEQFEFVMAIEAYKKVNHRLYPTWTEVLEVVQQLGYRKVSAREIRLENVPEPTLHKAA